MLLTLLPLIRPIRVNVLIVDLAERGHQGYFPENGLYPRPGGGHGQVAVLIWGVGLVKATLRSMSGISEEHVGHG